MSGRGMTLLEIMVAVFIVAIMMTFLLTIHVGSMRVRRRAEHLTEMNARARAAFDLLRRDLQGAFELADSLPEVPDVYAVFERGGEFLWEAPLDPGDLTKGFRRLSFFTAADGSRFRLRNDLEASGYDYDTFYHYEHAAVSWCVRSGALCRQNSLLRLFVNSDDKPESWEFDPYEDPGPPEQLLGEGVVRDAKPYVDLDTRTLTDVDVYRGLPMIRTAQADSESTGLPSVPMRFERDVSTNKKEPVPVNVIVCVPEDRTADLPEWLSEFRLAERREGAGPQPVLIEAGATSYQVYSRTCPNGSVYFGPNKGGPADDMYFVVLEPLWWSLGEDADDLVFRAPAGYSPEDPDGDGVYAGGVPEYVDVTLTIADPETPDPMVALRRFGERIWIPAGGGM